jgi:RHS repeat-associated protein
MALTDNGCYTLSSTGVPTYYFYLKDHQGNNRVVVSQSGSVEQTNHYYPYGALFAESTNGDVQRFKYNGRLSDVTNGNKELDRKFGLNWYDHGARHNDAAIGRWHSIDRDAEKYYGISPYAYCGGDPVNFGDYDGNLTIFINGQQWGIRGSSEYWDGIDNLIMNLLNDYDARYLDGSCGGWINTLLVGYDENGNYLNNLSSAVRTSCGYSIGEQWADYIYKSLSDGETIKVVTHSMGGAFGKGFVQSLVDYAINNDIESKIEFELDIAPYQPTEQKAVKGVPTYQASHTNDIIATGEEIPGVDKTAIERYEFIKTSTSPIKNYVIIPHAVKSYGKEIIKLLKNE